MKDFFIIYHKEPHELRCFSGPVKKLLEQLNWAKLDVSPCVTLLYENGIDLLRHQNVLVLGKLYKSDKDTGSFDKVSEFTPEDEKKIVNSCGTYLLERFWGDYIALVWQEETKNLYILRDPTGGMSCYYTILENHLIAFSNLKLLTKFFPFKISIDESFISKALLYPRLNSPETGITNIKNLMQGECLSASPSRHEVKRYWNAVDHVSKSYEANYSAALTDLKTTVKNTLVARAADFKKIFLYFSGGLDSAIVASVIKKFSPDIELYCFNYSVESSPSSYEYDYAKSCTESLGLDLHYVKIDPFDSNLLDESRYELLPSPSPQYIGTPLWDTAQKEAQRNNCDVIWDGDGGDQIFFGFQTSLILNDYLYFHKNLKGYLQLIPDVARLCDNSIFPILKQSWKNYKHLKLQDIYDVILQEKEGLISQGVLSAIKTTDLIPSFLLERNFPLGKALQIEGILNLSHNKVPLNTYPIKSAHPLASQPLVDLCLELPSYYLTKYGRSRGLVRDAMRDVVPHAILNRYTKGGTTQFIKKWFESPKFQGYLIEGYLTQLGYVNRSQLEKYLTLLIVSTLNSKL